MIKRHCIKCNRSILQIPVINYLEQRGESQKKNVLERDEEEMMRRKNSWKWNSQTHINFLQTCMELEFSQNRYFFQLIPIHLNRTSKRHRRRFAAGCEIKFALFLQNKKVAESREWGALQWMQDVAKCYNSSLDFCLANFNPDFYSNLTLKTIAKEPPSLRLQQDPEREEICRVEQVIFELGSFQLDPGVYIDTFNEDHKALFQENIEISPQLSMDYELYIERSRFGLEKLIRESRGANTAADILATAFKKRTGKKRVRYVELNDSGQKSVKEEEFKRNKKPLISSLRKNGSKYVPEKTVEPDSSSSRNVTPVKIDHGNESSLMSPESISRFKSSSKLPESESSQDDAKGNKGPTSPRMNRAAHFERSMIQAYWELDTSITVNRAWIERLTQKAVLGLFWGVALFLLYLTMVPSRKA